MLVCVFIGTWTHTFECRPMQKGKAQARPVTSPPPWSAATARPSQVCHCLSRPDLSASVRGWECWWMFPELLLCVHQKLECVSATSESELRAFEICWQLQRVVCSSAKPDQRGSGLIASVQNTCCAERDALCSVDCVPITDLRFGWKQNILKLLLLGGTWKRWSEQPEPKTTSVKTTWLMLLMRIKKKVNCSVPNI